MNTAATVTSPTMDIHLEHASGMWAFLATHYVIMFSLSMTLIFGTVVLMIIFAFSAMSAQDDHAGRMIISAVSAVLSVTTGIVLIMLTFASPHKVINHEGNRSNTAESIKSVLAEDSLVPDCDSPLSATSNAFMCGGFRVKDNPVKSTTDGKQYMLDIDYFNVKSVDANGNAKVVAKYIVRNP